MEPAGRIDPQPWMTARPTRAVLAALEAAGTRVRFVGGCVRDAVLGRRAKDIDIATPDDPETVVRLLEAAGLKAVPTGIAHGTITAVAEHQPFEVTTLREDVETDGRRARVAFTDSWIADAARRDFTMNAMFCEPDGTLYDPFGGWADLLAGRVRFVGEADQRIQEDYLRLLRFFRFHARYGRGAPEPEALAAAERHKDQLATLSGERIRDELLQILEAPDPTPALRTIAERGILARVMPEPIDPDRLGALVRIETDTWGAGDPLRRLAAAFRFDDAGAQALSRRLRLSRRAEKRLRRMVVSGEAPPAKPSRALWAALYTEGAETVRDRVCLAAAAADAHGQGVDARALAEVLAAIDAWTPKQLPVTGADAQALGVPRGPRVGQVLRALERWWIDQAFAPGRDACLAKLAELAERERLPGHDG